MKLSIEVTDNIGWDDERSPYTVRCFASGNSGGSISVGGNDKVNPIETMTRLDELARRIKEVVSEYYSSIEIPTSSTSQRMTSS